MILRDKLHRNVWGIRGNEFIGWLGQAIRSIDRDIISASRDPVKREFSIARTSWIQHRTFTFTFYNSLDRNLFWLACHLAVINRVTIVGGPMRRLNLYATFDARASQNYSAAFEERLLVRMMKLTLTRRLPSLVRHVGSKRAWKMRNSRQRGTPENTTSNAACARHTVGPSTIKMDPSLLVCRERERERHNLSLRGASLSSIEIT